MKNIRLLSANAIVAAIYTVLTFGFFFSFGPLQLRFSEALCLLCLFSLKFLPGLSVGCALSNVLGALIGVNPIGFIDSVVGTLATIIGCLGAYFIGRLMKGPALKLLLGAIPVILSNAVIVGLELMMIFSPTLEGFVLNSLLVGAGELCVLYTVGAFLFILINKEERLKGFIESL